MNKNRLRILHVVPSIGPYSAGAGLAALEMCVALAQLGHDVHIYALSSDIPNGWKVSARTPYIHCDVTVEFFEQVGFDYYWISPGMTRRLWRNVSTFDVVHIHSLYRSHLPITAFICKHFAVPYIVKPHGSLDPFMYRMRRWRKAIHERLFDKPAYQYSAAIQYVASEERTLAESTNMIHGLEHKSVTVPSAVIVPEGIWSTPKESFSNTDPGILRLYERFPSIEGKDVVLFLGRLTYKKGLDILISAFAIVKKEYPNAHLFLVGPDSEGFGESIRKWIGENGLESATTFGGLLQGDDKWAAFRLARVFALPSYTENFGIAIVEAMTQSCPVVITNRVNIWREISEAGAGIVTNCDVDETAEAIGKVLGDNALALSLGTAGRELAMNQFTWPAAARQMESVYYAVTGKIAPAA